MPTIETELTSFSQELGERREPSNCYWYIKREQAITREYKNNSNWTLGENEPKTNLIKANQSQLKPIKCQNKPNSKPIKANQNQSQNPTTTPTAYANISNKGLKLAILGGEASHISQDA